MAKRYYTEEAYEQIIKTIEQIDRTDVDPVQDFFGDMFQRLLQFLEIYSVEQYQDDMQKWYDKVLESHDTTIKKVKSIFKDVQDVDFEYRDIMKGAVDSIVSFQHVLDTLRDVFSQKTTLEDGKAAVNRYLAAGRNSLNGAYDKILTKMEQRTLWDASKALFGDALKLGGDMCKVITKRDPVSIKKMIDTATATRFDLWAMGSIIMTIPVGIVGAFSNMTYEEYLDYRYKQLTRANKLKDTDSVTDLLDTISEDLEEKLVECPEESPYYSVLKKTSEISKVVSKGSHTVDIVVDAYDIGNDLKDIDEWMHGKEYTLGEFTDKYENKSGWEIIGCEDSTNGPILRVKGTPGELISTLISDGTGLPASGWSDPDKGFGNVFKLFGTVWSWTDALLPDTLSGSPNNSDGWDVFLDKNRDTSLLKDIFDFARDLDELVTPDISAENSVPIGTSADARLNAINSDMKIGAGVN